MLERPWYQSLNYVMAAVAIALAAMGLMVIKSATLHASDARTDFDHQVAYLIVGVIAMAAMTFTDYHLWQRFAWPVYAANLLMLAAVLAAGHSALGAQRWISIGPVIFQPSEPAKLFTTLSVAAALGNPKRSYDRFQDYLIPIVALAVPVLLVLAQPDLGTALVLVAIFTAMLFFALPKARYFAVYAGVLAGLGTLAVTTPYLLHGYQRARLLVFLNPQNDPQGAGWSLIQSKIAIGSGMMFGKGLFNGTQTQLGFVPEHATDFIFTVIGEEWGFIGALALLVLYAVLLAMGLLSLASARDRYGVLVAAGITAMFTFHILINIGMTVGIMPITGIPLPFISYGGSSLITCLMAVGVLLNIHLQRDKISFDDA
ncbi:MAG TPA: rod shape-determining protein RodA [Candidatus Eremiobacteraceae bacterium]